MMPWSQEGYFSDRLVYPSRADEVHAALLRLEPEFDEARSAFHSYRAVWRLSAVGLFLHGLGILVDLWSFWWPVALVAFCSMAAFVELATMAGARYDAVRRERTRLLAELADIEFQAMQEEWGRRALEAERDFFERRRGGSS